MAIAAPAGSVITRRRLASPLFCMKERVRAGILAEIMAAMMMRLRMERQSLVVTITYPLLQKSGVESPGSTAPLWPSDLSPHPTPKGLQEPLSRYGVKGLRALDSRLLTTIF